MGYFWGFSNLVANGDYKKRPGLNLKNPPGEDFLFKISEESMFLKQTAEKYCFFLGGKYYSKTYPTWLIILYQQLAKDYQNVYFYIFYFRKSSLWLFLKSDKMFNFFEKSHQKVPFWKLNWTN